MVTIDFSKENSETAKEVKYYKKALKNNKDKKRTKDLMAYLKDAEKRHKEEQRLVAKIFKRFPSGIIE